MTPDTDELRARILELERTNRAKDEFLATLSHELRSPIGIIIGYADLLRRLEPGTEKFLNAVDVIESNAKAQAQLVSEVFEVSRIISGKFNIERRDFEVAALAKSAVDAMQIFTQRKAISLVVSIDENIGAMNGDPDRLRQVFVNLLSNAVKFTPRGGRVALSVRRTKDQVEIEVSDNGIGISEPALASVFDRFWQESTEKKNPGLGVGLNLVRHITEAHGGEVSASSKGKGHGATFKVVLPIG